MYWLIFFFLLTPSFAFAVKSHLIPERVLIIANQKSPYSLKIARLYQERRKIPPRNVLALPLPREEEITRPIYLKYLEKPLAQFLSQNHLEDQILAFVIMPEVPHKIKGRVAKEGNAASVDSELCLLYRKMLYGPYRLGGWLKNPYFASPIALPFEHDRFDIYLVTRLAGYQERDVLALIDRALKASKTKPPFTLVLDAKDGPTGPGDNWLHATYLLLKNYPGLEFELSFEPAFLASAQRVIGYASWGSNDPNYPPDRKLFFQFLPGAIGVTYVSTNARTFKEPPLGWKVGASWHAKHKHFGGSPQSLIGDLIRLGITGISGNVYEPYLSASARPYLLFPAYLAGKPLAEAYYRALAYLSWQTVVIGDPLTHLGQKTEFISVTPKNWFQERKRRFKEAQREKDHLFLAKVFLKLGLQEKAFYEFKKLAAQKETFGTEEYRLLFILAQNPKLKFRLIRLLKTRKEEPALFLLAYLTFSQKEYADTWQFLAPLLRRRAPQALFLAGRLKLKEKDCQGAIRFFEQAIAETPERWNYFPWLYKALLRCGQKERAQHIREKILQIPDLAELWPAFRD